MNRQEWPEIVLNSGYINVVRNNAGPFQISQNVFIGIDSWLEATAPM